MKSKVVSEVILILLFVSFLATYRAETEDVDTRVYVDPPISSAAPGYTFSIDVVLTNVTELSGWSFKLFWENSILECITEVIHYPLNCNWEDPNNIKVGPGIQQDYNETHGRWFRGLAALSMSEPYPEAFTGTIILASLNFTVIGLGVTTLHLQETKLSDPDAYPISHTAEDGGFEYEPPEHDVAVLLEAPCHVVPGDSVPLNATVLNGGLNDEVEVELNLLINGDPKDSMVISFLHAGSSHTLSYLWTPTVEAVYNVTAYALPVLKEEDIANNVKSQMVLVSDVIEVPLHYPTIQEAIDAASPKDTILVSAGTYYEELIIDKSMTVTGEENSSTIVDGSGGSWVFKIEADDVEISKFTIQNGHLGIYSTDNNYAVINGNTITNNLGVGIYLDSSNHNTVSGNTLSNNRDGILLEYSSHCVLRDNSMTMNRRNFGVLGKYMSNFVHDIDTSNTVDGKPVYYWVDQRDRIVPADAGYVGAIHSFNITVRDLKLANNDNGVLFVGTNNSTIVNVELTNNLYGVVIRDRSNNNVVNWNRITNNSVGIELFNSSYNTFSGNTIANNRDGIVIRDQSNNNTVNGNRVTNNSYEGIKLYNSSYNTFSGNTIANSDDGIVIRDQSNNNTVNGNRVTNNSYEGIKLYNSSYNTFSGNTIANNGDGVYLSESSDNTFFHNDFVNNSRSAWARGANIWDNGVEGNYWSDYTGLDLEGDGIGDTPCWIIEENQDRYPLMSPLWLVSADINFDGIIDIYDIVVATMAFAATPEHPRWNPAADMNQDGVVDIFDLVLIAINFGKPA